MLQRHNDPMEVNSRTRENLRFTFGEGLGIYSRKVKGMALVVAAQSSNQCQQNGSSTATHRSCHFGLVLCDGRRNLRTVLTGEFP